jgi:hypothetical protein
MMKQLFPFPSNLIEALSAFIHEITSLILSIKILR